MEDGQAHSGPPAELDRSDEETLAEPGLDDLSDSAADRIRRFLADSTVKGGASPADVADLYTAPEIVGDEQATGYLDRRYVQGALPDDWRQLQDDLTAAHFGAPPGLTGEGLLARVEEQAAQARRPRSIFDDPDDLDDEEDRGDRMMDRDPALADLTIEGREAIERHLMAEVIAYGIAPIRTMQLREQLDAAGDARSLQYLDLPHERGERPADWDELRDRALRLRARLESRGQNPSDVFAQAEAAHPGLDARGILGLLEEGLDRA